MMRLNKIKAFEMLLEGFKNMSKIIEKNDYPILIHQYLGTTN